MISTYLISAITIITMTISFFLFPSINVKGKKFDTYWMITLLGAILILLTHIDIDKDILNLFIVNNETNPLKIILLFLSLTFIAKFLDAVGLFNYLATKASHVGNGNQFILFTIFYILISILTIITNNDIIIIVTPIIIYFCRACKIKPLPYLILICFVLNTLSTTFLTTNVSNLYLGQFFNITYFDYFKKLTPISLILMIMLYFALILIFHRDLKKKITSNVEVSPINNIFLLIAGLIALIGNTILLILSSVINVEMYIITLAFALFDLVIAIIYCLTKKADKIYISKPLKSLPYEFIPFLTSMFIIVSALNQTSLLSDIATLFENINSPILQTFAYGYSSAFAANLVNNVPMSLLYADILNVSSTINLNNVYGVILSSNLCALITPCGALSSLMFMRICKENDTEFKYSTYLKFAPLGILLLAVGLALILII